MVTFAIIVFKYIKPKREYSSNFSLLYSLFPTKFFYTLPPLSLFNQKQKAKENAEV